MRVRHALLVVAFALLAGLTTASASAGHQPQAKAHSKTVKIVVSNGLYAFRPKSVKVARGTRIIWHNLTSAPHTITSSKGNQFNKQIAVGKTVSITFKKAGTYKYFCAIHPYMHATIVVK